MPWNASVQLAAGHFATQVEIIGAAGLEPMHRERALLGDGQGAIVGAGGRAELKSEGLVIQLRRITDHEAILERLDMVDHRGGGSGHRRGCGRLASHERRVDDIAERVDHRCHQGGVACARRGRRERKA